MSYFSRFPNVYVAEGVTTDQNYRYRLVKNIFRRVNEIYKIAELLSKNNTEKINFSNLLVEITKRTLNENKFESNLFFL